MLNSFSNRVKALWAYYWYCADCGKNNGVSLHHIVGRGGTKRADVEDSALNAIPLCLTCHTYGNIHSLETRKKYFDIVHDHLENESYQYTDKDMAFMKKYNKYFKF